MTTKQIILTIASIFTAIQPLCDAFAGPLPLFGFTSRSKFQCSSSLIHPSLSRDVHPRISPTHVAMASDIVDAEFEYVNEDKQPSDDSKVKTLIDVSLDMDPEWKDLPVPFIDPLGNNYIDCTMVFMVDFEGEKYVLATPREQSAAVVYENEDGSMVMLDADDDENLEIFQMASAKLSHVFDDEVILKRTPRTLTISGDLDQFTGNWRQELKIAKEQTVGAETLSDMDEDESFFDEFMKRELGADYDKIMEEEDDISDIDEEIMKLFEIPGMGTGEKDQEGISELLEEIEADLKKDVTSEPKNDIDEDSGLRLLSFEGPDGKIYSLLELLQPVVIVGKEDPEVQTRRLLLTKEEFDVVVPKLETYCRKDLEEAGLKLSESL